MEVNLALVVHERGKCEGFAAGATTVVQNHIAGSRIDSHGKQLAGLILHLEVAVAELLHLKEVALGFLKELDPVRCILRRLHLPSIVSECTH